jgi:hypothetical protein
MKPETPDSTSTIHDPIDPDQQDGMPYEVATAILTEPKAKLTAAMRRTCQRARDTVYSSVSPFRVDYDGLGARYATELKTNHADNLARKRAGYTHEQLRCWLKRAIARRRNVQGRFVKLQCLLNDLDGAVESPDIKRRKAYLMKFLAVSEQQASRLDEIRDGIETELERRAQFQQDYRSQIQEQAGINLHIDPQVRRRQSFLKYLAETGV